MLMPYELYQCLKYAISNQSIQILKLIYRTFEDQINNIFRVNKELSFWETASFKTSEAGLSRIQNRVIRKLDPANETNFSNVTDTTSMTDSDMNDFTGSPHDSFNGDNESGGR